jgi:hypothetical protein
MPELFGEVLSKTVGIILEKAISFGWERGRNLIRRTSSTQKELEQLKADVLMTMVTNRLDAPLARLCDFFKRHPELIRRHTANGVFVQRWMMDPYLQAWGFVAGMWTKEKFERLRLDVAALHG